MKKIFKMKLYVAVVGVIIILVLLLAGCGSNKVKFEDDPYAPPPMVNEERWKECQSVGSRFEWDQLNCGTT